MTPALVTMSGSFYAVAALAREPVVLEKTLDNAAVSWSTYFINHHRERSQMEVLITVRVQVQDDVVTDRQELSYLGQMATGVREAIEDMPGASLTFPGDGPKVEVIAR